MLFLQALTHLPNSGGSDLSRDFTSLPDLRRPAALSSWSIGPASSLSLAAWSGGYYAPDMLETGSLPATFKNQKRDGLETPNQGFFFFYILWVRDGHFKLLL